VQPVRFFTAFSQALNCGMLTLIFAPACISDEPYFFAYGIDAILCACTIKCLVSQRWCTLQHSVLSNPRAPIFSKFLTQPSGPRPRRKREAHCCRASACNSSMESASSNLAVVIGGASSRSSGFFSARVVRPSTRYASKKVTRRHRAHRSSARLRETRKTASLDLLGGRNTMFLLCSSDPAEARWPFRASGVPDWALGFVMITVFRPDQPAK
jgi:hypothetical protein